MADIAIFNNTVLCVIFKETQFNVSTKTIKGMRENCIYNISGSSVDNFLVDYNGDIFYKTPVWVEKGEDFDNGECCNCDKYSFWAC